MAQHKKNISHSPLQIYILVGFMIIVCFMYYEFFITNNKTQSNSLIKRSTSTISPLQDQYQKYSSSQLNLLVSVPPLFVIKERGTTILFVNNNMSIILGRGATDYSSIEEYVNSINVKNNLHLSSIKKNHINTLSSIYGYSSDTKIYFIYADHYVYSFSTSSPELYDSLDQIAQSFKYIPD